MSKFTTMLKLVDKKIFKCIENYKKRRISQPPPMLHILDDTVFEHFNIEDHLVMPIPLRDTRNLKHSLRV